MIVGEVVMSVMCTFLQVDVMDLPLAGKKRAEGKEESEVDHPIKPMILYTNNQNVAVESGRLLAEVLGVINYLSQKQLHSSQNYAFSVVSLIMSETLTVASTTQAGAAVTSTASVSSCSSSLFSSSASLVSMMLAGIGMSVSL